MTIYMTRMRCLSKSDYLSTHPLLFENWSNGQVQKLSIPNHRRLPCFDPPLPSEIPKCVTPPPPCPQNSIIMNPPPLQNFRFFLEVHFQLSNAYMNKRTWIYASSRLRSSGARWQALLFSEKKNLPLVARLCKLLFKSEFGYKNKPTYGNFTPLSLFSCAVLTFTKQNSSNSDGGPNA